MLGIAATRSQTQAIPISPRHLVQQVLPAAPGRRDVGLPAAPCLHRCLPASRAAGSKAPAAASACQAHPTGQGCSTISGFPPPPRLCPVICRSLKKHLMHKLPAAPSTSLELEKGEMQGKALGNGCQVAALCPSWVDSLGLVSGMPGSPAARCPPHKEQLRLL